MLTDTTALGSFAVDDLDAARDFYGGTLGLRTQDEMDGQVLELHHPGGQRTVIYPKPDHTPAAFTVLMFQVDDIDATVAALEDKGVEMLRYDGFNQDERGIARDENMGSAAWFADPAGNILGVATRAQ